MGKIAAVVELTRSELAGTTCNYCEDSTVVFTLKLYEGVLPHYHKGVLSVVSRLCPSIEYLCASCCESAIVGHSARDIEAGYKVADTLCGWTVLQKIEP